MSKIAAVIEDSFRKKVKKAGIRNAYLLVCSEKKGINMSIAEGKTGAAAPDPRQPVHMASVGKLFTSVIISMLYERGLLDFSDKIAKYLEPGLMKGLHIYKGTDYSGEIEIRHLLKQTSGLNDVFYVLYEKILKEKKSYTPEDAVIWGKENLKPKSKPGAGHFYTDTNYYLLGMIAEKITGKHFHELLHEMIFDPLGMDNSCMYGYSQPRVKPEVPAAGLYIRGTNLLEVPGLFSIDFSGGGIIAPPADYLKFMRGLVHGKLIKKETLDRMINDDAAMGPARPGMHYGYAVWKFTPVPILIPKKLSCWGCVGVTGAFMFYHPETDSYIIGSFNDMSTIYWALGFMLGKIIRPLL